MRKTKTKENALFNPDMIANRLLTGLKCDLATLPVHTLYAHGISYDLRSKLEDAFLKKYKTGDCDERTIQKETKQRFLENLARIESLVLPEDLPTQRILSRARFCIAEVLGDFSLDELFTECKHSSGVTTGTSYEDSGIHAKSGFPLTGDRAAIRYFKLYLEWSGSYRSAILDHISDYSGVFLRADQLDQIFWEEFGSRYSQVPKNNTINRSIAIEPTLNMFLQQGVMNMMYKRLARFGLGVDALPIRHRNLALDGSVGHHLATIDFSMASDSISLALCERLLPPDWFELLRSIRSPVMEIDGEYIDLPIISTMGNATTFPLETLIFWGVAVAILTDQPDTTFPDLGWLRRKASRYISCFGDDLIVPQRIVSKCLELFPKLGLLVNEEKSFYTDNAFRESCGGDYFNARNVRPFSLKRPDDTSRTGLESWLYATMNQVFEKYISYFGPDSAYHLDFLLEGCRIINQLGIDVKIVPTYMPISSGLLFISEPVILNLRSLGIRFSAIAINKHGEIRYSYLSFKYLNKEGYSRDSIAYYFKQKTHVQYKTKGDLIYTLKKRGRFINATGFTSSQMLSDALVKRFVAFEQPLTHRPLAITNK